MDTLQGPTPRMGRDPGGGRGELLHTWAPRLSGGAIVSIPVSSTLLFLSMPPGCGIPHLLLTLLLFFLTPGPSLDPFQLLLQALGALLLPELSGHVWCLGV